VNPAVIQMLEEYSLRSQDEYENALREIIQQAALFGLWRSRFFEKAAFYGGTALRVLYGLNRFSEDMDFSLKSPDPSFGIEKYGEYLCRELESLGFEVEFHARAKGENTGIQSAFLKGNTLTHMLLVKVPESITNGMHSGKKFKIKLEVDTDPPGWFATENRFVLRPVPFSVISYVLPDMFAGKIHAVLCRKWKNRVKGRDWYDMVWYVSNHPELHLDHLSARMKQSGDLNPATDLTTALLMQYLTDAVADLSVEQAKKDVRPFLLHPEAVDIWSREFFREIIGRIITV
jgi:hypothetical protein